MYKYIRKERKCIFVKNLMIFRGKDLSFFYIYSLNDLLKIFQDFLKCVWEAFNVILP